LTSEGTLGNWEISNGGNVQTFSRAGANYIRASDAAGILRFDTGGTTIRQKISNNGDISFYDDTGTNQSFFWDASAESLCLGNTNASASLDIRKDSGFALRAENGSGHYFRVAAGGNTEIGGTLDVSGIVTADGLTVNSGITNQVATFSSTDATAFIKVADNSTTATAHGYGANGNDLSLYANDSERVRILSTGDVNFKTGGLKINDTTVIDSSKNLLNLESIKLSDNKELLLGTSSDVRFLHNGTDTHILNNTGDLFISNFADDKDIVFRSDDGSGGVAEYFRLDGGNGYLITSKHNQHLDNVKSMYGGSNDLQIYHDGSNSNSFVKNSTGILNIASDTIHLERGDGTEVYLTAFANGSVYLYHNNNPKLQTTSTGIDVTGNLIADGGTIDGTFIVDGGTGVSSTGVLNVRQSGDGHGDGIAITSSHATSHRIWKNASGVLNIGSSSNTNAFQQDLTGNITIEGTVTTSDALKIVNSTTSNISLMEDGSSGADIKYIGSNNNFVIATGTGGAGSQTQRLSIQRDTGDISFYEDTGTTAKFFWDSSTERLGIGTTTPDTGLDIETTTGIRIKQNDQIDSPPGNSENFYQGLAFINQSSNTQAYSMGYGFGGRFALNYFDGTATYSRIMSVSNSGNLAVEGSVATGSFVLPDATGTSGQLLKWPSSGTTLEWADDTGTTINNNANNRIITGSSTANTLEAESTLTWDGSTLTANTENAELQLVDTSSGNTTSILSNNFDTTIKADGRIFFRAGGSTDNIIQISSGGDVSFYEETGTTQGFFWDASTERLGIGTTSPDYALDIRDDSNIQLKVSSTTTTNNARITYAINNQQKWNHGVQASDTSFTFYDIVNNLSPFKIEPGAATNTLVVDSNSRVGIGTNNPSNRLTVLGADSVAIDDYIVHYNDSDTKIGFPSDNKFKIRVAGSDKVTVTSTGLGIGTTSPDSLLHVGGASTDKTYIGTYLEQGGVVLSRAQGNECLWVDRWGSASTTGTITNPLQVFRPEDNYASFSSSNGTNNPVQWTIDATFSATSNVNARRVAIFAHSGFTSDLKIEIKNSSGVWETAYDDSYTFAGSRWHLFSIDNVISYPGDWSIQGIRVTIDNYGTSNRYIGQIGITNVKNSNTSPWITKGGGIIYDNSILAFGNSSDLQIYHDGSNSYIKDGGTGNLRIAGQSVDILNPDANEFKARFKDNDAVELYYDGQERLSTSLAGVNIPTNKELRFYEASGSEYTGIKGRSSIGTGDSITYQLPPSAPANSGSVLICTTAGEMTWSSNTISTYTDGQTDRVITGSGTSGAVGQFGLTYNKNTGLKIENMGSPVSASGTLTIGQSTNGSGSSLIVMDSATQGAIRFKDGSTTEASILISPNVNNGPLKISANNGVRLQDIYGIDTTTTTTTQSTATEIHTFSAGTFRSARITIQIKNNTDSTYHTTELLAVHDGTNVKFVEYGSIFTGDAEATFDMSIVSGNVKLTATPATTDNMTFKVVCHSITI